MATQWLEPTTIGGTPKQTQEVEISIFTISINETISKVLNEKISKVLTVVDRTYTECLTNANYATEVCRITDSADGDIIKYDIFQADWDLQVVRLNQGFAYHYVLSIVSINLGGTSPPFNYPFNCVLDTYSPTSKPTVVTRSPSPVPSVSPSSQPTRRRTASPTRKPSASPSFAPTPLPSESPTNLPTGAPTETPTPLPSVSPTFVPTETPPSVQAVVPVEFILDPDIGLIDYNETAMRKTVSAVAGVPAEDVQISKISMNQNIQIDGLRASNLTDAYKAVLMKSYLATIPNSNLTSISFGDPAITNSANATTVKRRRMEGTTHRRLEGYTFVIPVTIGVPMSQDVNEMVGAIEGNDLRSTLIDNLAEQNEDATMEEEQKMTGMDVVFSVR